MTSGGTCALSQLHIPNSSPCDGRRLLSAVIAHCRPLEYDEEAAFNPRMASSGCHHLVAAHAEASVARSPCVCGLPAQGAAPEGTISLTAAGVTKMQEAANSAPALWQCLQQKK